MAAGSARQRPRLHPHWGDVTPFAILSGDQFLPAAPGARQCRVHGQLQHRHGRCRHWLLGRQVRLQLLAAADGHSGGGRRSEPGHRGRCGMDTALPNSRPSVVHLGPHLQQRRGRGGPGGFLRHRRNVVHARVAAPFVPRHSFLHQLLASGRRIRHQPDVRRHPLPLRQQCRPGIGNATWGAT